MSVARIRKDKELNEETFDTAVEELGWRGNKKVALHFFKLGMITSETKKKLLAESKKPAQKLQRKQAKG